MPADRVFRRRHSVKHAAARSLRHHRAITPGILRVVISAVVLGLVVSAIVLTRPVIQVPIIESIDCTFIDAAPCPEAALSALQTLVGQPLLFSPLKSSAQELLSSSGFVVTNFNRVMPATVRLQIAPLDVLFYLTSENQTAAISIDGTKLPITAAIEPGKIVMRSTDATTAAFLASTNRIPTWLLKTVQELSAFFEAARVHPQTINLRSPFQLELKLQDQSHAVLLNPQESSLNLARLSSILKSDQYTALASPSATLDVRFRLPVLR